MPRLFPAKVSWWLFGPILALIVGSAVANLLYGALMGALVCLAVAAFVAYVVLYTRYELTDKATLHIQSGPFTWQVPVQQITRIVPTNNPLSSPAPSLDRLKISYNQFGQVMISPRDKAEFIAALQQINPSIQLG
ncbi:PH domain-containing protein [Solirubrum puertoriconensis]|uniref:Uncharacterized protein YyaB-like PH domain-containing protein n=1 Tax=Solirubrum puertoriconensis TaxID=1751427 RepID=A0A9X0HMC5_SOLP1|nr:PH domain-containing protein [Solirubrum puertoriconensis]KUG08601.1 hypothetical protein ASU33_10650 [Solirubrum puertoriconensis]